MSQRCIVQAIALGIAVSCLPTHARLVVTDSEIVARASAGAALPKTQILSLPGGPAADAVVSAKAELFPGATSIVRASGFQTFGGFDAASATIKTANVDTPRAHGSAEWEVTLENGGFFPIPIPVFNEPVVFGFTIPAAGMRCVGCRDSPVPVTAEISSTLTITGEGTDLNFSLDVLGTATFKFNDKLTVSTKGVFLERFDHLFPLPTLLVNMGVPLPTITVTGNDVALEYAPFSKIYDLGELRYRPGDPEYIIINYSLSASVAINGYGCCAEVSAFIADPFGIEGETVPGPFPPGVQLTINGASVMAVPEPSSYAFMLAGLGMVVFASRRRLRIRVLAASLFVSLSAILAAAARLRQLPIRPN